MFTDTHAHLDYPEFEGQLEEVLRRADDACVTRIIAVGTSLESSRRVVEIAQRHPSVFAAIGVHPTCAHEAPEDVYTPLKTLAGYPKVVAIGETGLDYHHLPSSQKPSLVEALGAQVFDQTGLAIQDGALKATQRRVFQQQLDLAVDLGLNVVIHQRDSWDDTLEVLRPYDGKLRAVYHCYGSSLEQALELIAAGHLVSFTGIITFRNAQAVRDTVTALPAGSFMLETDCPYLAPVPHRGKTCEPAHTRLVAERIAELRGESLPKLSLDTERTANEFFRFPQS